MELWCEWCESEIATTAPAMIVDGLGFVHAECQPEALTAVAATAPETDDE